MAQSRTIDYTKQAKLGFSVGVALLLFGVTGEVLGRIVFGELPGWEDRLFVYSEGLGIVTGFFAVFFFGVVLPLTE